MNRKRISHNRLQQIAAENKNATSIASMKISVGRGSSLMKLLESKKQLSSR